MAGATITLIGAAITTAINFVFIPRFGYMASAWATFACYATMMIISFVWGQKVYFVPYAWKKLLAYIGMVVLIFFLHKGITAFWDNITLSLALGVVFTLAFLAFIVKIERREFQQMPVIGKYIK